jgi:enamine deaminase RidA (YjgF/YER057c/UK114 family)
VTPSGGDGRGRVPAGRIWAETVGYSRAIRVGDRIEVSGTSASTADGGVLHPGDPYAQARHVMEAIVAAIEQLGGSRHDVIRTRVFLADMAHWREVGRAHSELFGEALPACSFVGGTLLDPELLVEVEASAVVSGSDAGGAGERGG